MQVLVTGAAGFIGSHVARHLAARGHEVLGVDDLSGGRRDNLDSQIAFRELDVRDAAAVEALFEERAFDAVFHLAAYAAEGLSHFVKRFNYENNLAGSVNLLVPAVNHDCRLFVFASSIAVYGAGQVPMRESTTPRPEDPYGIAKYAFELELEATRHLHGLPYVVFRPHNVYGEGQNISDPFRNVIGIFMRQLLEGEPMTVFGDGRQQRAFSYIDDVAPLIAESLDRPETWNQVFNVGADEPRTVLEVARCVAEALERDCRIEHLPARKEVVEAWSDHAKLRDYFGARETVPLEEGVARMARWVKRQGVPPRTEAPEIEIPRHLPPSWRRITGLDDGDADS